VSKKSILIVLLLACITFGLAAEESTLFVRTVPISRVYLYQEGYRVVYVKNDLNFGEIFLPISWFTMAGGKGEQVLGDDPAFPYFSVFWKDGEFSHIRLYLKKDLRDPSWGEALYREDIVSKFKDEPPVFEF